MRNKNSKLGFTLMELLVALAAASVLSLSALQLYGLYYASTFRLIQNYHRESSLLLQRVNESFPYRVKTNPCKRKIPGPRTRV